MFKHNLINLVGEDHLDSVIAKGYLKEVSIGSDG